MRGGARRAGDGAGQGARLRPCPRPPRQRRPHRAATCPGAGTDLGREACGLPRSLADKPWPSGDGAFTASDRPAVPGIPMINDATLATGHLNILDIHSLGKDLSHVST